MDDSGFKKAQRAYDNMSPPEDNSIYHEPYYPCDVCGNRDVVIVADFPESWGVNCCKCSRRVRYNSTSPQAAIESWEEVMMESQQQAKEDRRNDRD